MEQEGFLRELVKEIRQHPSDLLATEVAATQLDLLTDWTNTADEESAPKMVRGLSTINHPRLPELKGESQVVLRDCGALDLIAIAVQAAPVPAGENGSAMPEEFGRA